MVSVRVYFDPKTKVWCACANKGPWGRKKPFAFAVNRDSLCKMLKRRHDKTSEMIRRGEERRARLRAAT